MRHVDLSADIELYDSDRLALGRVAARLREHVGTRRTRESFAREVMERFAEEGYLVDVQVTTVETPGGDVIFHTGVTVAGRVDIEAGYDHERQRHEVRANILGVEGQPDAPVAPVAMPGAGGLWVPQGSG